MKMTEKQQLIQQVASSKDARNMVEQMKLEVQNFYDTFHDDTGLRSEWGHHYFCKDDGHVLEYNPRDSHHHICPICKKEYSSPLLDGVWVCIYRNEAALTVLKASILYLITDDKKYFEIAYSLAGFYLSSFEKFELHNKEGLVFDSVETMNWGCGRIMPQNLNESIFFIRIFTALELIKEEIPNELMTYIKNDFRTSFYRLLRPQIDKIHNISCWMNSAIGVVGLFCDDKRLIEFAFDGEFNINRQLREGVTEDGFWYEGSIHYNFFTLEGMVYLALFAKTYEKEFKEQSIIKKMLIAAYHYAFSNQQLPNPNDGWPSINLKSYSYIYAVGTKVFGAASEVGAIMGEILSADYVRGEIPLSKPYYFDNKLSLEQFLLLPDFKYTEPTYANNQSMDFEHSNYALLKGEEWNIFYKYGHHGPSHAHPDKMTIEVMLGQQTLTRDLSNSGYGSVICNEWHRVSASHNTVVVDGLNHTSFEPGEKIAFEPNYCDAKADHVYQDVNFRRKLQLRNDGFSDEFEVTSESVHTFDFVFHVEAELNMNLQELYEVEENAELCFKENGYSYFKDVKSIKPLQLSKEDMKLYWKLGEYDLISAIDMKDTEVFLARSPANPVTNWRTSIILRRKAMSTTFHMNWNLKKEGN
jgi:hypothetical protein